MLSEHLRFLICPYCREGFEASGTTLSCGSGHRFDIARQGYISLLPRRGREIEGDSAEMVAARAEFLAAGHYQPIADAVATLGFEELIRQRKSDRCVVDHRCVVDLGAGTGYYLSAVVDRLNAGLVGTTKTHDAIAVDVSQAAARRAARRYPHILVVVGDIRQVIPVASGSAGLALNVFAPRGADELERILAPDGAVLLVMPRPGHLGELTEPCGLVDVDPDKQERVTRALGGFLQRARSVDVSYEMTLNHKDLRNLVRMGPSAHHQSPPETEQRVRKLPGKVRVSARVDVQVYRRHRK
jgi:23S rRNA (guanine745-N1)-methyltransferase